MTGLEVALLGFAVMCLVLLIVALGSIDALQEDLRRERALRYVQHRSTSPKGTP